MSKTVLVTGVAGFIGSHVAQALLARGDTVVGLDNLNDYYSLPPKRANLVEVQSPAPNTRVLSFVEGDIRASSLIGELFARHSFDAVVHLAAMAGVRDSAENPQLYYDVNVIGTINVLDLARRYQTGNVVLASTSSVYGNSDKIPFEETDACDHPLAPYSASKRAVEMLGFTYHNLYGQNVTALRFFTVYGPRGRPDMMAYRLLDSIFLNKQVPLYNSGQMYRDWTFVDDIVSGIVTAVDRSLGYQIINLGRGEPVLLAEFVQLVEQLVGRKAPLVPAPKPDSDMACTWANIDKARRLLGYCPQVSVKAGVTYFWEWYRRVVLGWE